MKAKCPICGQSVLVLDPAPGKPFLAGHRRLADAAKGKRLRRKFVTCEGSYATARLDEKDNAEGSEGKRVKEVASWEIPITPPCLSRFFDEMAGDAIDDGSEACDYGKRIKYGEKSATETFLT